MLQFVIFSTYKYHFGQKWISSIYICFVCVEYFALLDLDILVGLSYSVHVQKIKKITGIFFSCYFDICSFLRRILRFVRYVLGRYKCTNCEPIIIMSYRINFSSTKKRRISILDLWWWQQTSDIVPFASLTFSNLSVSNWSFNFGYRKSSAYWSLSVGFNLTHKSACLFLVIFCTFVVLFPLVRVIFQSKIPSFNLELTAWHFSSKHLR